MADTPPVTGPPIDTDLSNKKDDADPKQGLEKVAGTTVQLSEGNNPMDLDTTKKVDPKGRYIKYIGIATVRSLTPADWEAAGVDSDKYVEWNYFNKKLVPISVFTEAELQYLLRVDGRFEVFEDETPSETTK
jgi:hypothetical protein